MTPGTDIAVLGERILEQYLAMTFFSPAVWQGPEWTRQFLRERVAFASLLSRSPLVAAPGTALPWTALRLPRRSATEPLVVAGGPPNPAARPNEAVASPFETSELNVAQTGRAAQYTEVVPAVEPLEDTRMEDTRLAKPGVRVEAPTPVRPRGAVALDPRLRETRHASVSAMPVSPARLPTTPVESLPMATQAHRAPEEVAPEPAIPEAWQAPVAGRAREATGTRTPIVVRAQEAAPAPLPGGAGSVPPIAVASPPGRSNAEITPAASGMSSAPGPASPEAPQAEPVAAVEELPAALSAIEFQMEEILARTMHLRLASEALEPGAPVAWRPNAVAASPAAVPARPRVAVLPIRAPEQPELPAQSNPAPSAPPPINPPRADAPRPLVFAPRSAPARTSSASHTSRGVIELPATAVTPGSETSSAGYGANGGTATPSEPAQFSPQTAHPPATMPDPDEWIERAMQQLSHRLEIESERRGFTPWA